MNFFWIKTKRQRELDSFGAASFAATLDLMEREKRHKDMLRRIGYSEEAIKQMYNRDRK